MNKDNKNIRTDRNSQEGDKFTKDSTNFLFNENHDSADESERDNTEDSQEEK